jgi:Ca-activated chloride channel family protein
MGVGHTVTVLYEIVPQGATPKVDPLRYGDKNENSADAEPTDYEWLYVKTKYKHPDSDTSEENIELAVTDDDIDTSPENDFLFASAVAEFAMLLKDSEYCDGDMADVIARAKDSRGYDEAGYRSEFIRLAQLAQNLMD